MKDFLASFVNTNGVAFPNTAAVNSSGGGATDGTEFVKIMVDDFWGWMQALLNYTDDTPNGNSEVGASQLLTSMQKMRALITTKTDNSTHTVYDWNKLSVLILDTGCTTGRIEGSGADRSNKIIVYNKIAGTVNIDFGVSATQEVLTMQKDQWIEFSYDNTLGKFVFQKSNKEIIITVTTDYTIGDWIPNNITFICNPNTATQYGLLTITLPTLADNIGKKINICYGNAGGTYGGIVKIDGEGSESLNYKNTNISFMYLFGKSDEIVIIGESDVWKIKHCNSIMDVGWINFSDQTNRHLGLCKLNYDTLAVGNIVIGTTVIETGGNACKGVVIYASNPTGSGYVLLYNVQGGGVFTNNNVLTFSNGTTALVNEGTGDNKNQDADIYHGLGLTANKFISEIRLNTTANITTSWLMPYNMVYAGTFKYGVQSWGVDTNNFQAQTAATSLISLDSSGSQVEWISTDAYYTIFVYFKV